MRRAPTAAGSASSTSIGPVRRSWRSSPSPMSGRPSRPAATPRSSSCCSGRSAHRTPTWSGARCGSRPTSRCGRAGTEPFGTRTEVKNMNSFRAVERAIAYEIERQAAALDAGETLRQETRGWSDERGETYLMRSKETSRRLSLLPGARPAAAARGSGMARRRSAAALPELPAARRARYRDDARAVAPTTPRSSSPTRDATAVRGDASRRRRTSRPRPSPTGSPASTCGLRNEVARRPTTVAGEPAPSSPA